MSRRKTRRRRAPRAVPISVGDVLLASTQLEPRDEKTRSMILGLLGFETAPAVAARAPIDVWKPIIPEPLPPPPADAVPAPPSRRPALPSTPHFDGANAASTWIGRASFATPEWAAAEGDPFTPAAGSADSLPPPPLFAQPQSRALLGAALATWREGSEVDVPRVLNLLAGGRRLERVPYRPVLTLRRGAQVLVDRAMGMDPYRHDIDQVVADLKKLFGPGHLEILEFTHCPSRGVRSARTRRSTKWKLPGRGVPVLTISDVGIDAPLDDDDYATASEWLSCAAMVRESGCLLAALVPVPPTRWPPALARAMALIFWSERTTVRQVVKVLREAQRMAPAQA